ncbi:MAG TPA: hypothetical protein VEA59_02935 [Patescibacteria group bacterium]|nr:hypothetical protein [Patescibacteria group bacterium]
MKSRTQRNQKLALHTMLLIAGACAGGFLLKSHWAFDIMFLYPLFAAGVAAFRARVYLQGLFGTLVMVGAVVAVTASCAALQLPNSAPTAFLSNFGTFASVQILLAAMSAVLTYVHLSRDSVYRKVTSPYFTRGKR